MSIFGEMLPYEDDTATSLIRREGYPPVGSYDQIPQIYNCSCCSNINQAGGSGLFSELMKEQECLEKRRLMQLDVFDERAKPITIAGRRPRHHVLHHGLDDEIKSKPDVPLPPETVAELCKSSCKEDKTRLIVTIHYGKGINAHPRDPTSVLVRCGAFEGQTAKVPRGKGNTCTWGELFEFPYPNAEEPLEVLVVDDALSEEQNNILGGVVVPPYALLNRARGDEEMLPICPEAEMYSSYGRMKETPMGSVIVSWYVKSGDADTEPVNERQKLEEPLNCVFVVHNVFQYTDTGVKPFEDGVLCVLRDMDDNCSESAFYQHGELCAASKSPYYDKLGCNYLPNPTSEIMQLVTDNRLGHILVCVSKNAVGDGNDELLVVGAVTLEFDKLYHKGSAVLLVESRAKEDTLWGEISVEWYILPHSEIVTSLEKLKEAAMLLKERDSVPCEGTGESESLFLTVVHGIDLKNRDLTPLKEAQVSVFAGDLEGATVVAPKEFDEDKKVNLVTWNQEVHFIEVEGVLTGINVQVLNDNQTVSAGHFSLDENVGAVTVRMHDPYDEDVHLGDIVVNYRRLCATNSNLPVHALDLNNEDNLTNGSKKRVASEDNQYNGIGESRVIHNEEKERCASSTISRNNIADGSRELSPEKLSAMRRDFENCYSNEISPKDAYYGSGDLRKTNFKSVSPKKEVSKQPGVERQYSDEISPKDAYYGSGDSRKNNSKSVSPKEAVFGQSGSRVDDVPVDKKENVGDASKQEATKTEDHPESPDKRFTYHDESTHKGSDQGEKFQLSSTSHSEKKHPRVAEGGLKTEPPKDSSGTLPLAATLPAASRAPIPRSFSQAEHLHGDPVHLKRPQSTRYEEESRLEQVITQEIPKARQPWFPARSTGNEDHIPLKKRGSFIHRADSIRDLERRSRGSLHNSTQRVARTSPRDV